MKEKSIRNSLVILAISSIVFFYALYKVDPRSGVSAITVFLSSLFVLVTSVVFLFSFTILNRINHGESAHHAKTSSLRRGVLVGLYVLIALALSALQLLTWWDGILLAFSLLLFELYFMSGKEKIS